MIYKNNEENIPVRRSLLWVSGDNIANMSDAAKWGADVVTLDIEDTVTAAEKPKARKVIAEALRDCDFGTAERWVRINGFHTPFAEKDLEAIVPAMPDAVRLPKIRTAEDVKSLEKILERIEREIKVEIGKTKVVLNIESASGILNLKEIATVSKRVIGMVLGGEDFTESLKIPRPTRGLELPMLYGRQHLIIVARAIGVMAFDSVYLDTSDMEGLRAETQMVKELGMDGKNVIHPKQVPIVNEVYTPSSPEIDFAVRVVRAYEEAEKKSQRSTDGTSGVLSYVDGRFIGPPVVEKAWHVIRWARACGVVVNV